MDKLLAGIVATLAAYLPHLIFGSLMGDMTELVVSTLTGIVVYAVVLYWLRRLRGDF